VSPAFPAPIARRINAPGLRPFGAYAIIRAAGYVASPTCSPVLRPCPINPPGEGTVAFVATEDGAAPGTLCRNHVAVRYTAPGGQPADPVGTPAPRRPASATQPPLSAVTSGVGEYRIPSYGKSVWRRLSDGGPDIGPALTPADDRYQISSAPACHKPAPPAATPPPTPCPDAPPAGPFPDANS
jgi:hypothetical protein